MLVTRNKFLTVDRESIRQKSQKIGRHFTVVYKAGYCTNLAFLDLFL